jgi:hypothetical protein
VPGLGRDGHEEAMDVEEQETATSFLRRSHAVYEAMVAHLLRLEGRGDDEATLRWLSLAATVAWVAHPGRYADERLESVALRIGERLEPRDDRAAQGMDAPRRGESGRRRVLHVATTVYEVGGHTRLIESWMKNDDSSVHSLILLHQRGERIRGALAERIAASGGELIVLPDDCPLMEKARRLRHAARSGCDCIILHTHPNDVVPLVALASSQCPPVALMNHADHAFWLGVSVTDLVVDFRDFGSRLSRERRGARESVIVPLPLDLGPSIDRAEARTRLGIPDGEVTLLTIGSSYKYTPAGKYDFFRTLHRVLDDNPAARLYVIGVSEADLARFGARSHERMELLGALGDPSLHEAAADLYLEGFPWGSYTAFFESVARGVCPVLLYGPTPHTDISGDLGLKRLVTSPVDEPDYVARVTALIDDPATRRELGAAVGRQVRATHGGPGSRAYLHDLYDRLAGRAHLYLAPAPRGSADLEEDLNLARISSAFIKTALLHHITNAVLTPPSARELLRLFVMSIRAGDTRLVPTHVRGWLGVLRRQAFPPKSGAGR